MLCASVRLLDSLILRQFVLLESANLLWALHHIWSSDLNQETNSDWLFNMSVKRPHERTLTNECSHIFQTFSHQSECLAMQD